MTPRKVQSGTRVRAARTIRDGNRQRAIYQNTQGTVLDRGGGTATVTWDDQCIFLSVPMTPISRQRTFLLWPATLSALVPTATTSGFLRFASIQDLRRRAQATRGRGYVGGGG